MKKWLLQCSIDGINIDFETEILSEKEPDFWTCQNIAEENNCSLWLLNEV